MGVPQGGGWGQSNSNLKFKRDCYNWSADPPVWYNKTHQLITYAFVQNSFSLGNKSRSAFSVGHTASCEVNFTCLLKTWIESACSHGWDS